MHKSARYKLTQTDRMPSQPSQHITRNNLGLYPALLRPICGNFMPNFYKSTACRMVTHTPISSKRENSKTALKPGKCGFIPDNIVIPSPFSCVSSHFFSPNQIFLSNTNHLTKNYNYLWICVRIIVLARCKSTLGLQRKIKVPWLN